MSERTTSPSADINWLPSWEGPAVHAPGVLYEEAADKGMLGGVEALAGLADWLAVVAFSGVIGNAAYEVIKTKVRGALRAWRRQKGQGRLDELKQQVLEEMQKHRANGKLTEEELAARVEAFFAEIAG